MYEVINEELGIKACGLADLTAEQVSHFLGLWEEGAKIGALTAFVENDTLVLNKNNKMYAAYRDIAEAYMGADDERRKEIRKNCQIPQMDETFDLMEKCLESRKVSKELLKAENNVILNDSSWMVLYGIRRRYDFMRAVSIAFRYGVMQGKRAERAKKKRQSIA